MKIAIDKGHCLYGFDTSADGRSVGGFLESEYDRILGDKIINLLRQNGHEVVDVTVDNGNQFSSMYGSLGARTSKANANGVDLYIAIHFNAGGGRGVETYLAPRSYYGSDSSYNTNLGYASRVQQKMVSLGFVNRGVKTEEFYVLTNTNAHAILIETCFCDSVADKQLYDSLGADRVAKAIVEGILNISVNAPAPSTPVASTPTQNTTTNSDAPFRVRKPDNSANSQIFASGTLEGAKANCPSGYCVFDKNGTLRYSNIPQNTGSDYDEDGIFYFNTTVKIRTAPTINGGDTGLCYYAGEYVKYHHVYRNRDGYNWIQYTRSNGQQGYCAVRDLSTGERYGYAE